MEVCLDPFHISERFINNENAILASFWYGYSYCYGIRRHQTARTIAVHIIHLFASRNQSECDALRICFLNTVSLISSVPKFHACSLERMMVNPTLEVYSVRLEHRLCMR